MDDDEFKRQLLERLMAIEHRLDSLDADQRQLKAAYARSRSSQAIVAAAADVDL